MSKKTDWIRISPEDFGTLAICAIRYCQGRETYMPGLVRDIVRPRLPELSDMTVHTIMEDCDRQKRYSLYGDERIDKPGWDKWAEEVQEELKRREG